MKRGHQRIGTQEKGAIPEGWLLGKRALMRSYERLNRRRPNKERPRIPEPISKKLIGSGTAPGMKVADMESVMVPPFAIVVRSSVIVAPAPVNCALKIAV